MTAFDLRSVRRVLAVGALLGLGASARAQGFVAENGDAGSTLSTAQVVSTPCEDMPGISGTTAGTDVDLFRCQAGNEGIIYESDYESQSASGNQFIIDVQTQVYERGFEELGNVRVRTKRHIVTGREYLVGTGATLTTVAHPPSVPEIYLSSSNFFEVGTYRHTMYFREMERVERLPRQNIQCASNAIQINHQRLDLLVMDMEVLVNSLLWISVDIEDTSRFGFHIESMWWGFAAVVQASTGQTVWTEQGDSDDPLNRDLGPVLQPGELSSYPPGQYLIAVKMEPSSGNYNPTTLCMTATQNGWATKRGDMMMILTGGGAEIGGLAAAPNPQGGVDVSFQATEQRTFGYRVDALDAGGAVVARDTLASTTWSGPASYAATLFAGALPSGTYRLRLTPLGRCSYTDGCPIDADAVESGLFVGSDDGPEPTEIQQDLTLSMRGANPVRTGSAELTLSLLNASEVELSVYDLLGRTVVENERRVYLEGMSSVSLDTSRLPSGSYVVRAVSAGGSSAVLPFTVVRPGGPRP